jgi:hypothetical protein
MQATPRATITRCAGARIAVASADLMEQERFHRHHNGNQMTISVKASAASGEKTTRCDEAALKPRGHRLQATWRCRRATPDHRALGRRL